MEKITNAEDLKRAIQQLEEKRFSEGILLKEHFFITYASLKPINIIKSTVKDMVASSDLKIDLVKLAFGSVSGVIAKKVFVGETHNPFSKLLGFAIEKIVSSNVIKNADEIKSFGSTILNKIMNHETDMEEVE